ncbi:XRE family transcriptional regulator [Enterococcus faecalis]
MLLTGFGYQPFWLFSAIIFIGLLLVFPIIFSDYWIINQQDIMVHQFSRNPILKIIECIKNSSTQIKIPYSEIESIEIIYTKKIRASAFDSSPDYFYLLVTYNNQTTKLYLDIYAKRFLPQFIAFLSRQRITIIDKSEIIELLVSDTSLYQHFNEKNVATDNRK